MEVLLGEVGGEGNGGAGEDGHLGGFGIVGVGVLCVMVLLKVWYGVSLSWFLGEGWKRRGGEDL